MTLFTTGEKVVAGYAHMARSLQQVFHSADRQPLCAFDVHLDERNSIDLKVLRDAIESGGSNLVDAISGDYRTTTGTSFLAYENLPLVVRYSGVDACGIAECI
jgi:hypothetical protein